MCYLLEIHNFVMRVGLGYDIHRLVKGKRLFLGGLRVVHEKGLLAHSDGDVILHAVGDALLGAMGKGDIGEYFPNTESKYKNIASAKILGRIFALVKANKFKIENLDITLIAEKPKILPYKKKMKETLGKILEITAEQINIKATTNEGIGLVGRGQAMACFAVVVLEDK
jgi:2-C-methyl-D-erythritol 2,4-cyclodiphosphate synthase